MAQEVIHWRVGEPGHVEFFLVEVLAPLATAARVKDFAIRPSDPAEVKAAARTAALETARIWLVGLEDVPREALVAAVRRLIRSARWLPKPSEIREAAAEAVAETRAIKAAEAARIRAACDAGCEEGFRRIAGPDGVETLARCSCRVAADLVLTGRPAPIALPAARESEALA